MTNLPSKRVITRIAWALGILGAFYFLATFVVIWGFGYGFTGFKEQGWTALHDAVTHRDNPEEVASLIANGQKVDARNASGNTPLHLPRSAAVARVLLRHGADVNAMGMDGGTPLQLAAEYG